MIRLATLLGLVGLAAATGLILYQGAESILAALASAGLGLVWASLFHLLPMLCNARGWTVLMPGRQRPSLLATLRIVWIREAVNTLLPVAKIGGEVVGIALLRRGGMRPVPAVGCMIVDMTLTIVTQFLFTLFGLGLLAYRGASQHLVLQILLGALIALPLLAVMLLVQRQGFFALLARLFRIMFGDRFDSLLGGAAALDRGVRVIYRRRWRILVSMALLELGLFAGAGEIWIAAHYIGHPLDLAESVLVEALIQAIGSAAFVVPGALGVQEGGFMILGAAIGMPAEAGLALALSRRVRDILVFVPALIAWQVGEGKRLLLPARARDPAMPGG